MVICIQVYMDTLLQRDKAKCNNSDKGTKVLSYMYTRIQEDKDTK